MHFELSPGQAHETTAFTDALQHADVRELESQVRIYPVALAGDKAYRAQWIIDWLLQRGIEPVIPEKGGSANEQHNPAFDRQMYRRRNVIERLVGWLKECRRVFSRFEKTALNFAGMIKLAIIQRYLRLFCPDEFSDRA